MKNDRRQNSCRSRQRSILSERMNVTKELGKISLDYNRENTSETI